MVETCHRVYIQAHLRVRVRDMVRYKLRSKVGVKLKVRVRVKVKVIVKFRILVKFRVQAHQNIIVHHIPLQDSPNPGPKIRSSLSQKYLRLPVLGMLGGD
jgi:hypothetical protein